MKVTKFGGSSLANAFQIQKVCSIVLSDEDRKVMVVSAPGKRTKDDIKVTDQSPVAAIPTIIHEPIQKNLCFNLMGQRLQYPHKGIVIKDGKKFVML